MNDIEQLKKENQELKKKLSNLQTQLDELLQKVQTYLDAQEMQKRGLLIQLNEKLKEMKPNFS